MFADVNSGLPGQKSAVNGPAGIPIQPTQTGSYTFGLADANTCTPFNLSSAGNATIPANSTVPFKPGTVLYVRQSGTAAVTIVGASGVTLNQTGIATASTDAWLKCVQSSANVWDIQQFYDYGGTINGPLTINTIPQQTTSLTLKSADGFRSLQFELSDNSTPIFFQGVHNSSNFFSYIDRTLYFVNNGSTYTAQVYFGVPVQFAAAGTSISGSNDGTQAAIILDSNTRPPSSSGISYAIEKILDLRSWYSNSSGGWLQSFSYFYAEQQSQTAGDVLLSWVNATNPASWTFNVLSGNMYNLGTTQSASFSTPTYALGTVGATATANFATAATNTCTLTSATACTFTFTAPKNPNTRCVLYVTQPGSGTPTTITPPSSVKAGSFGTFPQPTATLGATTRYEFDWDGTSYWLTATSALAPSYGTTNDALGTVGATATANFVTSAFNSMTLTSATNCTISFTAPPNPCYVQVKITAPASGTIPAVTWPSTVVGTPVISTTLGKSTLNTFFYDGGSYVLQTTSPAVGY